MKIHGTAVWQGGIKDGKGAILTKSGAPKDYPYGFSCRFEGKPGTNPEELIGAETGDERREIFDVRFNGKLLRVSNYCAAEFPGAYSVRITPPRANIVDALWHFRFVARSWRAAGIDVAIRFTRLVVIDLVSARLENVGTLAH